MPFLSRWAGTVVGLTLLAIGALGIYESWVEGAEHAAGAGAAEASSSGADEAAVTLRLALEGKALGA